MTPEQKDRIKRAAVELGAALTDVGELFHVEVRSIDRTRIHSERPYYAHIVKVTLKSEEVIA